MDVRQYRERYSRHCELERYFPDGDNRDLLIKYPQPPRIASSVTVPGRQNLRGNELHHICGSGNGAQRQDVVANIICVCNPVHIWLEHHKLPGFVLCCWAKLAKCELEWDTLESIKGKKLPSWLETDEFIRQCEAFPWIETMRRQLTSHRQ